MYTIMKPWLPLHHTQGLIWLWGHRQDKSVAICTILVARLPGCGILFLPSPSWPHWPGGSGADSVQRNLCLRWPLFSSAEPGCNIIIISWTIGYNRIIISWARLQHYFHQLNYRLQPYYHQLRQAATVLWSAESTVGAKVHELSQATPVLSPAEPGCNSIVIIWARLQQYMIISWARLQQYYLQLSQATTVLSSAEPGCTSIIISWVRLLKYMSCLRSIIISSARLQ